MKLQMIPSKALSLQRFCVVLLCFLVVLVSSFLSAQTFVPSDSVVFVSKDSYLYAESPVYISDQTFRKDSSKKWSKTVANTSSSKSSNPRSISNPTDNLCYKSCPTGKHSLGFLFNSSSMAVIGNPSPIKLQHKTIPSSFFLFKSARRDEQKHVHFTSLPFQLTPITINHFGRPPPVLQS
ncbi:hypothetical protein [Chryseobacterium sp. POE27]|uniref:hypothetical protein n=1 Tax=Chryseobacterium sp. POE27 TaxID=3138177 RepID=UPI003219675E